MLINYIQKQQQRLMEQLNNFYTPNGIHVYVDSPINDKKIDLESVISKVQTNQ